jgi:tRNA(fMet)-specific endonuclease VapC
MSGSYLLDTNIVIALFADEIVVKNKLVEVEIFVPSIVLGELYFGAGKSKRAAENIARIEDFAARSIVLDVISK